MADFKMTKIIEKKRNGEKLLEDEINYFINSVVKSANSDKPENKGLDRSQIGAMLMAIYFKGLDKDETRTLTREVKNSGFVFTWPKEWRHLVVDKHSTGGVGDKVSLILAPTLAALGLKVPMISGRSLSHTGGTLDKLESIPGFRVCLNTIEIYNAVHSTGCCIVSQTTDCVPADKILYQCREITATITCPPLIIASIVSKKLCEGTEALVYDVKYGKGSLFSSKKEAEEMARSLVQYSEGVKASAFLTSMESPLGKAIGNSVEIREAIDCLKGGGPSDVLQVTCVLGNELLRLARGMTKEKGTGLILQAIQDGRALRKFHDMIIHQGVSVETAKELCYGNPYSILPKTEYESEIYYDGVDGYIQEINPLTLANIWKEELFQSNQHPGVGLTLLKVVGDEIKSGEAWIRVHHQSSVITDETLSLLRNSLCVGSTQKNRVLIEKKIFQDENSCLTEHLHFCNVIKDTV